MILDSLLEFADAMSMILGTGTTLLTNQIDLGIAGRDPGNGQPMWLGIHVTTEIDSAGEAATLAFALVSDSSAAIHVSGRTEHFTSAAFTEAQLTQGSTFYFALPVEGLAYERFLGVQAVVAGEAITSGAISAFLTLDPHGVKTYPDAQN